MTEQLAGGLFANNALDLTNSIDRKKLVLAIENDIDAACRAEFAEDPRTHLGASVIGDDCRAKAWNAFRWLKFEQFDGRMLRLFNRGHEEEARFVRWLTIAGWEVREFDPETKKQFRIVGSKGHFGGSLDGMAKAPSRYAMSIGLDANTIFLLEFKTHSEKSFAKLKKDGVVKSKPQHYRQMCSYGRAYGFHFALYCAVNKNTDELYFEVVQLDWREADDLFRKAEGIIFSQTRPPKIAQTDSFFDCKYCDFAGLCHRGEVPTKNCRSCRNAFPVDNAEWFCQVHNANIPKDVIPVGCSSYARIA
ncbi:hypothetical protein UFOVP131_59 [uncultured Caudovirales phage]|uniref:PD-(D/E)XK nuclease superfamily n=1 Tax=uncultured Caudovirales phage TaxID=2100421 RepID=A0A6J5LAX5_9CAUD|nr:hypothetical protein UFOVP131_59 [uncultured Caudovirales phage]